MASTRFVLGRWQAVSKRFDTGAASATPGRHTETPKPARCSAAKH